MNECNFETEFTDTNKSILRIFYENEEHRYSMMIDTYDDPYKVYYCSGRIPNDFNSLDEFENILFDYLREVYPDYF